MIKRRVLGSIIFAFTLMACHSPESEQNQTEKVEKQKVEQSQEAPRIFPKGQKVPEENFTGEVYFHRLLSPDSVYTTTTGNVHFEKMGRTNWHSHPSGQLLIVTAGEGYHQIKGEPKERIKKGDLIKCPPNKDHWHGATETTSMTHIFIVPNTEKGIVDWKEAVTDEQFTN